MVGLLKHLLRHLAGKLLLLWDDAPIHHSQPVKAFLAQEAAERIHLERLPGYAPELNPDEGIWRSLKRAELRNVCCAALSELRYALRLAIARLRHTVSVMKGCISHPGYQRSFTRQQSIRISNHKSERISNHKSDPLFDGGQ